MTNPDVLALVKELQAEYDSLPREEMLRMSIVGLPHEEADKFAAKVALHFPTLAQALLDLEEQIKDERAACEAAVRKWTETEEKLRIAVEALKYFSAITANGVSVYPDLVSMHNISETALRHLAPFLPER